MKKILTTACIISFALNTHAQLQSTQSTNAKGTASLKVNDNNTRYKDLMAKGHAALKSGKFEKAVKIFTDALAFNIGSVNTLESRAMTLYLNKSYSLAIKDFDKLIEGGEGNIAQSYFLRGTSRLGLQDSTGACEDLKRAKELGHDVRWEGYAEACGN